MNITKLPLFTMMGRRMDWLMQREAVLAQNIANADSPQFQPRDLTQQTFRQMLGGGPTPVRLASTSDAHLAPTRTAPPFRNEKAREVYETALDGNAVNLEEQMMKVSETQGAYRLATNLFQKHVSMLKAAIGRDR